MRRWPCQTRRRNLRSNLHLVDGVQVRVDDDDSEDGVLVIRTIQLKPCAGGNAGRSSKSAANPEVFAGGVSQPWICAPGDSN